MLTAPRSRIPSVHEEHSSIGQCTNRNAIMRHMKPVASLPKPIALPDPRAFQHIYVSVPFVQNIPIIPFVQYPSFENQISGPRSSIRTCRIFCQRTDCIGSKRRWPNGMCNIVQSMLAPAS